MIFADFDLQEGAFPALACRVSDVTESATITTGTSGRVRLLFYYPSESRFDSSDYVAGQVWGRLGSNFLLLDQVRARMDCPATVKAVQELSAKWPHCAAKLIEDKANGSAVIQMLANQLSGLIPVNPEGGKIARAAAVSPLISQLNQIS